MEPSWRWIFPGSHQHCCLICHFVQWIKAISCSALKPLVHFMNNSCKYHFRSQSSKVTGKGYSWDVQKKKKGRPDCVCKAWGCFCELLHVGGGSGRAEQALEPCAWHKATSAASLVSLCPFKAQSCAATPGDLGRGSVCHHGVTTGSVPPCQAHQCPIVPEQHINTFQLS